MSEQPQKRTILVIDDEPELCDLIRALLEARYEVFTETDPERGLLLARQHLPDLILLDFRLPRRDGIQLCDELRRHEATRHIQVIMLTGNGEPRVRTEAFRVGVDDFVDKPFSSIELIARIQSKLRRIEEREAAAAPLLCCGNLRLDLERMQARVGEQPIELTSLEFKLLRFLVEHREHVLSRERILESVWRDASVTTRTVDTHVSALRKRLQGCDHEIASRYGAGYQLKPRPPAASADAAPPVSPG